MLGINGNYPFQRASGQKSTNDESLEGARKLSGGDDRAPIKTEGSKQSSGDLFSKAKEIKTFSFKNKLQSPRTLYANDGGSIRDTSIPYDASEYEFYIILKGRRSILLGF